MKLVSDDAENNFSVLTTIWLHFRKLPKLCGSGFCPIKDHNAKNLPLIIKTLNVSVTDWDG